MKPSQSGDSTYILGAGVTGLAAAYASGLPVFEAEDVPGGICASYYLVPGDRQRLYRRPAHEEAYRFEFGGGHWIFGGDPAVLRLIRSLTPVQAYRRTSGIYFAREGLRVPFPLQYHLKHLEPEQAASALYELSTGGVGPEPATMAEWLRRRFGPTLAERFFSPFHDRYTAGLYTAIAPQDDYKSPLDLRLVLQGALQETPVAGYNTTFVYPEAGLDGLARQLAARSIIHYGKRVTGLDVVRKVIGFADGSEQPYTGLVSTLPLSRMMELAGLETEAPPDPYTSVLVLNIGARRGAQCPELHWVYVPDSASGFFRVGFYSNVDPAFLPVSARGRRDRVALYVERAFPGGARPEAPAVEAYARSVVAELQAWGVIEDVDVLDPTWIEVAYTWSWPGSRWRRQALAQLEAHDVVMVGRYGRWTFQGIADSIRDGLFVGATLTRRPG